MRTASPAEGNQGRGTHRKKITHHELSVRKRSRWVLVFKAPLARREQRDRRIPFGTDEGKAGGRWPPLREGPICVDCFPEHRRGAQWAPVLPYTLRRLIWLSLCLRRAAGGRPYARAQSAGRSSLAKRLSFCAPVRRDSVTAGNRRGKRGGR